MSLEKIANQMVETGKGILAADESTPTCKKKFDSINLESNALTRNQYRDMLFNSPELENYISGIILFDETFRQKDLSSNQLYPDFLSSKNILPGIKVDLGLKYVDSAKLEQQTRGLEDLYDRASFYFSKGAKFSKWRSVFHINNNLPSDQCIKKNSEDLAEYALICQSIGLVPIVEPEVLMDGNHSIQKSYEVTSKVLNLVFESLSSKSINFEGMILKPNMVLSGYQCSSQSSIEQVAESTLQCLKNNVPSSVPGIAFLSGGQSEDLATRHLNLMNLSTNPWKLTFSYGRALQTSALNAWKGESSNIILGQKAFLNRAKANSLASQGLL